MPALGKNLTLVLLAAASLALAVLAFRGDEWARESILAAQGKNWKKTAAARFQGDVSRYGDWPPLMLLGGAGLFVAWRARNREWQRILVTAMVASTVAGLLVNTLRLTTGRTRPNAGKEIEPGWYGPYHDGRLTVGDPKYNSFPSGHTATAFGFAGVLFFARPRLGALVLVVAGLIAFSRMRLDAHHLSDVTVAALIALWVAWLGWTHGERLTAWSRRKIFHRP